MFSVNQGYRWEPVTKSCYPPDICAENALYVKKNNLPESALLCSPEGTLKCISDPKHVASMHETEEMYILRTQLNMRYKCICRNAFMGVRCDRYRDACVEVSGMYWTLVLMSIRSANYRTAQEYAVQAKNTRCGERHRLNLTDGTLILSSKIADQ
ncbi:unnamed protein product [Echinostoma caproni]|uniref:EGF-like domain-containing protein n=1 Tax=Echinostoma caproni TaxID=27848 RepID=A0A183A0U8_9TREM|nr:unnamed protein product [Echinostoma caproni]